MAHGSRGAPSGTAPVILAIDGLRPLGHRSTIPKLAVAGAGWLVFLGALSTLMVRAAGSTDTPDAPAWLTEATAALGVSWLAAMAVAANVLRHRVPVRVTADEVTVGTTRLPRAALRLRAVTAATGSVPPRLTAITLTTSEHRVRLAGTRRPHPRFTRDADVLVPAGLLDDLHEVLTDRAAPGTRSFPLPENASRRWARDMLPLWGAVAVIGAVNATLPRSVLVDAGIVVDVAAFSVVVLWTIARTAPPRPATRRLVVHAGGFRLDDPYTGRLVASERWEDVTVRRNRWRTPGTRYTLGVTMEAFTLVRGDGRRIIAIALPEPLRDRTHRPPRIRAPRWIAQPESAQALAHRLRRRCADFRHPDRAKPDRS